jgi:hypothetical protein
MQDFIGEIASSVSDFYIKKWVDTSQSILVAVSNWSDTNLCTI